MPAKKEVDAPDPRVYGFNPISHHYVKKSGPVWLRLVKAGIAQDPELLQGIQERALARKQAAEERAEAKAKSASDLGKAPKKTVALGAGAKSKAIRAARKLVAENQSELDGLESDAVDEKLSKVMAKRLALADTTTEAPSSSDSETEKESERKPPSSRIRLKSQPIPIPKTVSDRRAALRASLSMPIYSDEE